MTLIKLCSGLAVAAALCAPLAPWPAAAVGSVAVGMPADVANGGFALGVTRNYSDRGESDAEALKQCLSFMDAPDSTRALCKLVSHYENQCFAVAMDPEPGTYGVGYKVGVTQSAADSGAMNDCVNTSINERKGYCQVSYRACDGNAH